MHITSRLNMLILIAALSLLVLPVQAAETKFVGEVNDTLQLVTDEQIYDIEDNEIGNRLVYEHIGDRVEVTGTVKQVDDVMIITVTYFKVIPE